MPAFTGFKGADHFYNVAFHELTHWTGHKSRLDRDLKNRFGSRSYAAEELIAELGAAFLCAEFGFDLRPKPSSSCKRITDIIIRIFRKKRRRRSGEGVLRTSSRDCRTL